MSFLRPLLIATCVAALHAADGQADLRTGPVVIRSEPIAGSELVDPGLKELRVTFDRPMTDDSFSWPSTGAPFPTVTGKPRFMADHRTCILPIQLQPGITYVVGVNYGKFSNFKDTSGRSALPWALTFTTARTSEDALTDPAAKQAMEWAKALSAEQTAEVVAHFDDKMKAAVPEAKLAEILKSISSSAGSFQDFGKPRFEHKGGSHVAIIPCRWERQTFNLTISTDAAGRINGLWFLKAD